MSLALTLTTLAIPLFLGIGAGRSHLFDDPDAAIHALNRYVLYLAFPVLIVTGMVDRAFTPPSSPAFYAIVPTVAATLIFGVAVARRLTSLESGAGVVVLTALFGNTAYVGLPVIEGTLGPQALGLGALAVGLHVTTSMIVGPAMLLVWGGGDSRGALTLALGKVAKQPLAWAPVLGFALRVAPADILDTLTRLFGPVGRSASPVGLFLIGLFIHTHWRGLRPGTLLPLQLVAKLAIIPFLTFGITALGTHTGWITAEEWAVLMLLSAMPTAISTFAIAKEFDTAVSEVTVAIVASTGLAAVVIPGMAMFVEHRVGG